MNALRSPRGPWVPAVHAAGAALLVWWLALQAQPVRDTPWHFLFNSGFGAVMFAGGVVGFRRAAAWGGTHSAFGRALRDLSAGAMVYGTALFIWTAYALLGTAVPVFSLADAAWFVSYAFFIRGMVRMTRSLPVISARARLAAAFVVPFLAVAVAGAVAYPYLWEGNMAGVVINIAYFGSDMVLLCLALVALALWGGRLGPFLLVLTVGLVDLAVADVVYTIRFGAGTYYNADAADLLYAIACYVVAAAIVAYLPAPPGPARPGRS